MPVERLADLVVRLGPSKTALTVALETGEDAEALEYDAEEALLFVKALLRRCGAEPRGAASAAADFIRRFPGTAMFASEAEVREWLALRPLEYGVVRPVRAAVLDAIRKRRSAGLGPYARTKPGKLASAARRALALFRRERRTR